MQSKPLVSIITPVFNTQKFLSETVRSVLNQTYGEWELLLIDDQSTDESYKLACEFAEIDKRIRVLKNPKNLGVSATRNVGVQISRGDWIAFLDSDDFWESNKLESQLRLAEKTGGKFIYGEYSHISEEGSLGARIRCSDFINYEQMLMGSEIGCLTVMIYAEVMKKYRFKNVFHEDYILWLEILKNDCARAFAVKGSVAKYRLRPNSLSANKWVCAKAQWNIYRSHENLNLFHSLFNFFQYAKNGIVKHWLK